MFFISTSSSENAAMYIQDDRGISGIFRRPDIQKQTILTVSIVLIFSEFVIIECFVRNGSFIIKSAWLITAVTIGCRIIDIIPASDTGRIFPASGNCVTYSFKNSC